MSVDNLGDTIVSSHEFKDGEYVRKGPTTNIGEDDFKTAGDGPVYGTFGDALTALRQGKRLARVFWNGKGMYIYYVPAASYATQTNAARIEFVCVPYRAYLAMRTVDGSVVPWVASQSDILADDWMLVEN